MNTLNITTYEGKRKRLISSIAKAVELLPELPDTIEMTQEQYEMIKSAPQLGDYNEQYQYNPEDRIYMSPTNAMEIRIIALAE